MKNFLAALALTLTIVSPVFADCNCMKTSPEEAMRQQREVTLKRLPSEGDRQLARSFNQQGLVQDARTYFQSAVQKTASENEYLHAADIMREFARFQRKHGQFGAAAKILEQAVENEIKANRPDLNLETEYSQIAALYVLVGDHANAAQAYKHLLSVRETTKGRYSPEAAEAQAAYNQALKRLTTTGAATARSDKL
jgi:tetratricopeptide (TPR) repeat protein